MKKESSDSVLYHEWVPVTPIIKVFVSSLVLLDFIIMIIVALTYQYVDLSLPILISILSLPIFFLVLMVVNYRGMDIRITSNEVRIYYGVINRKRICTDDIVGCEIIRASFRSYGGMGIRYGFDGSWAYVTSFGPAVKIALVKGRPFVFSSKDPDKICGIIGELTKKNTPLPA